MNEQERVRRRAQQKAFRAKPQMCACGEFMGTRRESGSAWVCERCWRIEQQVLAARLKWANRGPVLKQYVEPYRLHLAGE